MQQMWGECSEWAWPPGTWLLGAAQSNPCLLCGLRQDISCPYTAVCSSVCAGGGVCPALPAHRFGVKTG